jgi:protoporphyrinogen oxidase
VATAQASDVLIVGAGLCGLSAAYHLQSAGLGFLLIERNSEVGGLARTTAYDGFSFDHSIHILYTADDYAAMLIQDLLGGNLTRQERASYCYSAGVFTEYPYQANNYGLPADVIVENILGLVEAHYASTVDTPPNFEAWLYHTFGKGIAENFMVPYNRRQWAWDLKDMSYDWIADRVPMPSLRDTLVGALRPPEQKYGPNREFWYPAEGGIEALPQAFAQHIPEDLLLLGTSAIEVDVAAREVLLSTGSTVRYDSLISTAPLPTLFSLLRGEIPSEVESSVRGLKHNTVHTVNIGLRGAEPPIDRGMHWVYCPEEDTIFHRISFPHLFSPWMVPPDCVSIQAEISESRYRRRDRSGLVAHVLRDLATHGFLTGAETRTVADGGRVVVADVTTLDPAYIIYDLAHEENVATILDFLSRNGIQSRGRFGEWEYFNMDHSILSGKEASDELALSRR